MIDHVPDLPSAEAQQIIERARTDRHAGAFVVTPVDDRRIVVSTMPPPRPGYFAEREELDAALQAGTVDALLLFIERHPNSRYRPEAEAALRRLGIAPPLR